MRPYYQGQIDVFCAIYAVINALALTHRLRADAARSILHESILEMAADPVQFREQLAQNIEYHDLVDRILNREVVRQQLFVRDPFGLESIVPADNLWNTLVRWLARSRRAAILRFVRPLALPGDPLVRHWTTVEAVNDSTLVLFDCSREESALRAISREHMLTSTDGLRPGLVYVDPSSIRLVAAEID